MNTNLTTAEDLAAAIVKRGESSRFVVETMAIMASGKANLARKVTIGDLFEIENAIFASAYAIDDAAAKSLTRHIFAPGLYVRELTIPEGMLLTGAIHKTEHVSIMASGDISILTVDGMKRMTGVTTVPTVPGVKRIGYAHKTTIWMDVHVNPTDERDEQKLWDMFYHNKHE